MVHVLDSGELNIIRYQFREGSPSEGGVRLNGLGSSWDQGPSPSAGPWEGVFGKSWQPHPPWHGRGRRGVRRRLSEKLFIATDLYLT